MKPVIFAAAVGCAMLVGGASAIADPASKPKPAKRDRTDCFFNRQVQNFSAKDDKTLYVRAGRDVYRMDMFGRCTDLDTAITIALDSSPGNSICSAMDVRVIVKSDGLGVQRCPVRTLTKLTPQEVAALPKGDKP